MATKILVVGPVQGQLDKAFQKITKLHAKTDFAFAIVVGDLFAAEDINDQVQTLLSGSLTVPLPTYFTVGDFALPQPVQNRLESTGEICQNLFYLGRKGTLTTTEGIKIVFLGGKQVQHESSLTQSIGRYDPLFLENEARVLQGAHSAHILLTSQWPTNIQSGSSIALPSDIDPLSSSLTISNLCATLKPRYHFSPSPTSSWKREPFVWPIDYSENAETQVTRFESVGGVLAKTSEWVSAFTIDPSKPVISDGAQRAAPFTIVTSHGKRKRDLPDTNHSQGRQFQHNGRGHGTKRQRTVFDPNDCFMCLGKPTFSSEMVVSIGEESFATSLRGALPLSDTFPQLKSTGNLMIIPMYHAADEMSHGRRTKSELESEFREMTQYRHALQHMLIARSNGELGAVCWEVNRTGIRHFHWQWIACPQNLIAKGLVEAAFKIAGEKDQHDKFRNCYPNELLESRHSDYFRVWIWSTEPSNDSTKHASSQNIEGHNGNPIPGSSPVEQADILASGQVEKTSTPANTKEISMYFEVSQNERFNIQFGRKVMSSLLKLEDRVDWRSVPIAEGDEGRDAEAWKTDFAEFDFAML